MSSFYAELRVAGRVYVIRLCEWKLTQATDARGRVIAKVRHGKVYITLDVPNDTFLEYWANAPFMPLPGCVVFFQTKGGAARETLSWEEGHCVGYEEEFQEGSSTTGSYVCHIVIAAPKLTMSPGGPPQPFVAPAPREHGTPQVALLGVPPALDTLTGEELAAAITSEVVPPLAPLLVSVAVGAALTLILIGLTATPAQAPGLPVDPKLVRLRELIAKHAAGTLTKEEEAELIDLLAKVRGVHIQSLSDLNVRGPLRGDMVHLPGFHNVSLTYVKRTDAAREALRKKFDSSARSNFLKKIGTDPSMMKQLEQAGFNDKQIARIASGKVPSRAWQVHHKLPLDDGGDNSFGNLMLIKNDPYHQAITNLQNSTTNGMKAGETLKMQWPVYNGFVYPATK